MSGNPAKQEVFCYLITKTEVVKPDELDILGYEHNFWPGEIVSELKDLGPRPQVIDYKVDSLLTFRCTIIRVAIGEMHGDTPVFPPAVGILLQQLAQGLVRQDESDAAVHQFADILKERIERPIGNDELFGQLVAEIDAAERDAARGRARA